jgi:hypothetical protein
MVKLLFSLLSALPLLAAAQVNPAVERFTYSYIDPGAAGTFAGASMAYNNSLRIDPTFVGDAFYAVSALPLATGISFYAVGGASVDPASAPDGTPSTPLKVTAPGSADQGWGFDYNIVASPVPGQSFLQQDVVGGHHVLRFNGGGFGLLNPGARFFSSVVIAGDWSDPSLCSPVLYGAGYNLLADFEYNAGLDITVFSIDTPSYDGTNPSIGFYLIGAPVPEPSAWALAAVGLAVLAWSRRRGSRLSLAKAGAR